MTIGSLAKQVPQTIAQADAVVCRMRRRNVMIAEAGARAKELTTQLRKVRASMSKMEAANETDQELVLAFADPRRDELTQGGKAKSFNFPSGGRGQWGFPARPKLNIVGNLPTIARLLLRLSNWDKYLDIRLRKDAIKADFDELKKTLGLRRGLRIDRKERFWVRP